MDKVINSDDLHPGDFEPGSVEGRAAARAALDGSERPPVVITEYVEPALDPEGKPIYGGRVCDSRTAVLELTGEVVTRLEGESYEDFEQRCIDRLPALKMGFVRMRGDGAVP